MSPRRVVFLLTLSAVFATRAAWADDKAAEEAEALVTKGVALRQEGKDADALALFRKAFEKTASARARAQIGLAEQALGMWLKAEEDLASALASPDAWVERYREPIEAALRTVRGRLGSLELVVNVPNADVFIDGAAALAASGRPIRVEAGTRTVTVKSAGHHAVSRNVVVPGGGVARETLELAPIKDEATGGPSQQGPQSDGSSQRTLGITLLAGSGLVLAGALTSQLIRLTVVNAYNDDPTCPGEQLPSQPPACADRISSARTMQTLAIAGYAVGGALALSGAVVLLTAPAKKKSGAMGCAPSLGERGATVVCSGRF